MLDKCYSVLVTAIGSFSADCVISTLKELGCYVVGCDTYPPEWHAASKECDKIYRSPYAADEKEFIDFISSVCKENKIRYLFPLIDVEIDVLNKYRDLFSEDIILCIPDEFAISIARDKYLLYKFFKDDAVVPSILTYRSKVDEITSLSFPYIAKPINGRSSEGMTKIENMHDLKKIMKLDNFIVQQYLDGHVFAVDYVRSKRTGHDFAIPREELLRTKNGAGTTVQISNDRTLIELATYIGRKLDVNGCINMEFIKNNGDFFLIDVNPRFSAGVAFSKVAGYSMVESHFNCFVSKNILDPIIFNEQIITKKYIEEVLAS